MSKTYTMNYGAFSEKHRTYIKNWYKYRMMCAEGAIRSGKTVDHCIIAAAYLETTPDKYHLATGSTAGNAKLNIGVCNGYGLENLFRGRCRWSKYRDNDALIINTQTGEKVVIFAGGKQSDSYKKILGNSFGLWIATEVNEHYDCLDSRSSFIKVAFGRQLAAQKPFTLWDLNPCNPDNPIYTDYIEPYRKHFEGGFCYEHFTIMDNATLTRERLNEILSQYVVGSIWYRRDILGERCIAQGLVFPYFADDPKPFLISDEKVKELSFDKITMGVDFGGNGSMSTFCLVGYSNQFEKITVLEEHGLALSDRIDAEKICDEFVDFTRECAAKYGHIAWVFCDSASPTMINSLVSASRKEGLGYLKIAGVRKNAVSERPKTVDRMLTTGRLKICEKCTETQKALSSLLWDNTHPDIPEDKNLGNINDRWDAFCYSWLEFGDYFDRR